jgi:integrase
MAVRFYLDKRADKQGDHPIRASISIGGDRFITSSGYSIAKEKWNTSSQQVKKGCSNAKGETYSTINAQLKNIDAYFDNLEDDFKRRKIETVNIREHWAEKFGKRKIKKNEKGTQGFFDYLKEYTNAQSLQKGWSNSMHEKYQALANHIKAWNPKVTFEDFTEEGLTSFMTYLQTEVVISGKLYKDGRDTRIYGMQNSTIRNRLGIIKSFLNWAYLKEYHTEKAYQSFKPNLKTAQSKVVFLDWKELMHVYNYPIPENKKYLERVRDVFCFCCFTSLRYSDVANLKRSGVKKDRIEVTTIKTNDSLVIDLNDNAKAILKKYKNETFPHDKALPVISNQRMNEYVKELGELCGIDEPVTKVYFKGNKRFEEVYPKYALLGTHTARRTFISNAIMMGIPPQVVMGFTGHSDYKAMKPYIEIADRSKTEAMEVFNKKASTTMKLKEEFTTKMHSELHVSPEIEKLHRCITLWCYTGIKSEDDPRFLELCKTYNLEPEFAISKKNECQALAGKTNNQ